MRNPIKKSVSSLLLFMMAFLQIALNMRGWTVDNDLQIWPEVVLNIPLSERNSISTLATPRFGENGTKLNQMIMPQVGLFHKWNEHLQTGVTAEYFKSFHPVNQEEFRLGEDIIFYHKVFPDHKHLTMSMRHRIKIEERFQRNVDTVVRLRIQNQIKKSLGQSPWYLVARNEAFVNLNSARGGPQAGFEQNRAFAGLGRKLKSKAKAEGGYQLMYLNTPSPAENRLFHTIYLKLVLSPFN